MRVAELGKGKYKMLWLNSSLKISKPAFICDGERLGHYQISHCNESMSTVRVFQQLWESGDHKLTRLK